MISYICKGENCFLSTYICNFSKLSLQRVLRTRSHSTLAILKSRNGTDYSVELKRRNQVNELLGIYLAYVVLISSVVKDIFPLLFFSLSFPPWRASHVPARRVISAIASWRTTSMVALTLFTISSFSSWWSAPRSFAPMSIALLSIPSLPIMPVMAS